MLGKIPNISKNFLEKTFMNLQDFLAMIAFEHTCADVPTEPAEYGYSTWYEAYQEIQEHAPDGVVYWTTNSKDDVYLTEDLTYFGDLKYCLARAYNEAAWTLSRAKDCGVVSE